MEQARRNLKITSIIILILTGLSLVNLVCQIFFGAFKNTEVPEGIPENIILIVQIVLAVITFLFLLPQLYIGLKGLKIAKNPNDSKGHIVWGFILLAMSIIGLLSPLMSIVNGVDMWDNVSTFLSILVEVLVFFDYVRYARAIAKLA